jgi:hypothetical protein
MGPGMWQAYFKSAPPLFGRREIVAFEEAHSVERVTFLATVALFALTYLVFCISPIVDTSDSLYSLALSESILHKHITHLNQYYFPEDIPVLQVSTPPMDDPSHPHSYQLGNLNGKIVYVYPNGSSILSIPFVAFMNAVGKTVFVEHRYSRSNELTIQKLLAALLMALLTCVVFRTALLILPVLPSAIIAVGFAFGTQVWSTGTRALWSQTWLVFLGGIAAYQILSVELGRRAHRPMLLATVLSWMYFVRPTAAIPIACVTVFVFLRHREDIVKFALTGLAWFAGFIAYSWSTFGELIPGYYRNRFDVSRFWTGLYGSLFSPSRGLFVYVPVLGFVVYLLVRYRRTLPQRHVAMLATVIVLTNLIAVAAYPCWWGSYCYGARLMMDSLPWFVLLAILGCAGATTARNSNFGRGELAAAFALLALSIAINARGAFSISTQQWSTVVDVDKHPEHVFEWSYPQFAAGLVSPPEYVIDNIRRLKHIASSGAAAK